jgi:hypothetical protein
MASNRVYIAGDSSALEIVASNLTGADPLEFVNGSFRSCPEERRVCSVVLNVAGVIFELRMEFLSPAFVEHSVVGAPVYSGQDAL